MISDEQKWIGGKIVERNLADDRIDNVAAEEKGSGSTRW